MTEQLLLSSADIRAAEINLTPEKADLLWKRSATIVTQIDLSFEQICAHRFCFESNAFVPSGIVCCNCGALVAQFIAEPPEILGYESAAWSWHHRFGKPWVTQAFPIA